jgi:hypothetical protein
MTKEYKDLVIAVWSQLKYKAYREVNKEGSHGEVHFPFKVGGRFCTAEFIDKKLVRLRVPVIKNGEWVEEYIAND